MGKDVTSTTYTGAQRREYREAVARCLDALERMLQSGAFVEDQWRTGMEIELSLVDNELDPADNNHEVLEAIDDERYQTELGRHTIELNVEPRTIDGHSLRQLEGALRRNLNRARDASLNVGSDVVMIGILPTLTEQHAGSDWLSDNARYRMIDEAVRASRLEDVQLEITGPEPLTAHFDSVAVESVCTSLQLHLQVRPKQFARYWNASQVLAAPQLAVGANSPTLFGHRLWAETRPVVFLQATDIRPPELRNQGMRPIVTFGERWITSIFDLFEENVRYYPALLPEKSEENPLEVLTAGGVPHLHELTLHNGTIYRWNRPIYAVVDGQPHLRVENRVLPAGPTVIDTLANAAFFYGAVVEMVDDERPLWSRLAFQAARDNFEAAARHGAEARLAWPGDLEVDAADLVLRTLLPMAQRGLARLGVATSVADRYLEIIERRAALRVNGASWQVEAMLAFEERGMDRPEAIKAMLSEYIRSMHANEPVHTWPIP